MTGLLGTPYSMNQASYDLTRLRHNGLIVRVPDHHRYTLTPEGIQFAIFYTKVHDRVLKPLLATHSQPHAPPELRAALRNHRPDSRPAPRPRPATHGSLTPHPPTFKKDLHTAKNSCQSSEPRYQRIASGNGVMRQIRLVHRVIPLPHHLGRPPR